MKNAGLWKKEHNRLASDRRWRWPDARIENCGWLTDISWSNNTRPCFTPTALLGDNDLGVVIWAGYDYENDTPSHECCIEITGLSRNLQLATGWARDMQLWIKDPLEALDKLEMFTRRISQALQCICCYVDEDGNEQTCHTRGCDTRCPACEYEPDEEEDD